METTTAAEDTATSTTLLVATDADDGDGMSLGLILLGVLTVLVAGALALYRFYPRSGPSTSESTDEKRKR